MDGKWTFFLFATPLGIGGPENKLYDKLNRCKGCEREGRTGTKDEYAMMLIMKLPKANSFSRTSFSVSI